MSVPQLKSDEMREKLPPEDRVRAIGMINEWLERGDGVAAYENVELGSPELGRRQFASFGSEEAFLVGDDPPTRLPDALLPSGYAINWRYQLQGTYRGEPLLTDPEQWHCEHCGVVVPVGDGTVCADCEREGPPCEQCGRRGHAYRDADEEGYWDEDCTYHDRYINDPRI